MRTLLLRPPPDNRWGGGLRVPPMGLAYLASAMTAADLPVFLLDAYGEGLTWDRMAAIVRRMRPDVLGLSAMSPVRETAYRAARLLRPWVRFIVLGGPHATAVGAEVFSECPEVDFVAVGEGEISLPRLVRALEQTPGDITVPGMISRSWDGRPAEEPDLDRLPFPARHLLPAARYHYPLATRTPMTTMVTSRGCTASCRFCTQSVSRRPWRARSAENVLDDLQQALLAGIKYVCFYDDDFTVDRARVSAICQGILARGLEFSWKCEARVDGLDPELLALMARAGCQTIAFGVETANEAGLEVLGKNTRVGQARSALRWARRAGIETLAYIMVGIPGESPEDVRRSLAFCLAEGVSVIQVSTLSAEPGTALRKEAEARGWQIGADVKGLFDDDLHRATLVAPGWTQETLAASMREAQRIALWRPSFVWRQGWRALRGQWRTGIREGGRFLMRTLGTRRRR